MSLKYQLDNKRKTELLEVVDDVMEENVLFFDTMEALAPHYMKLRDERDKEVASGSNNHCITNACNASMYAIRKGLIQAAIEALLQRGYKITLEDDDTSPSGDYALAP